MQHVYVPVQAELTRIQALLCLVNVNWASAKGSAERSRNAVSSCSTKKHILSAFWYGLIILIIIINLYSFKEHYTIIVNKK